MAFRSAGVASLSSLFFPLRPRSGAFLKAIALMLPCIVLPASADAIAQSSYPSRTIKIVVGFPAGTAPDTLARLVADGFKASFGQPVVVENAVGAGGNLATERVAKADPDGYTLLMAGNAALVVNQSLYEKLPYDPKKELAPISQVAATPNVLVVHPDVPAKSVAELVALARARPDSLSYAHVGIGTSGHIAAELLKTVAGISMQGVSYRGGNVALTDLLADRIQVCFCNIANAAPLAKDGRLRPLAVTSTVRSAIAPDWPTMQEAGFNEFSADAWFGLVAPAGTPAAVIARLHAEMAKLMTDSDLRKTLLELGAVPLGNSPAEFAGIIDSESAYWANTIKRMGLTAQ